MINTYLKTLARMFGKHVTRLLSLIFMVLISVGFISGIGSATDKINYSLTDYYKSNNVSDFIIRDTTGDGFTRSDIEAVKSLFPQSYVDAGASVDVQTGEKRSVRLYFLDYDEWTVNLPDVVEGAAPSSDSEIFVERADNVIEGFEVGETYELDFGQILISLSEQNGTELDESTEKLLGYLEPVTVTVSGIIQSPLTFSKDGEPSDNNPEDTEIPDSTTGTKDMDCLENVLYISKDLIPTLRDAVLAMPGLSGVPNEFITPAILGLPEDTDLDSPFIKTGSMYVAIADRTKFNAMSAAYESFAEAEKTAISEELGDGVKVLTLFDNYSFKSLSSYSGKVAGIGYILMAVFLLVTALVVLSTMTRLLEEERSQIACMKTLGYNSMAIISKYLFFSLIATGIGGFGAYFVGLGLARLLYFVFNYSYAMPPISSHVAMVFYIITLAVIVVGAFLATLIAGLRMANDRPANLLRPKPPKAGKKVVIEKIPLIWNRLSFKYKSTVRNVLRYKSRFLMTVIAVAFSTGLVLTGLALLDMCLFRGLGSAAIMGIAVVVVAFAGLLTAVVIYTLTNINISERNREIATLMVLGYYDGEVAGYIYREIYINSLIGIIFGYPVAVLLMMMVFGVMGFGSIGAVTWFWWLLTPVIVLLFTGFVTLLLRRKIIKIDMNESLKAIE